MNNKSIPAIIAAIAFFHVNVSAQSPATGQILGHDYVDLGLSVKWATCNIGANSPSDYGDYFAWGEAETKTRYIDPRLDTLNTVETFYTADYAQSDFSDFPKNIKDTTICKTAVKYLDDWNVVYTIACIGEIDGSFIRTKETFKFVDTAHAKLGSTWRMPTEAECKELIDNCKWKETTVNGRRGYIVKSRINGNSIFLPYAGVKDDNRVSFDGELFFYWTSACYQFEGVVLVAGSCVDKGEKKIARWQRFAGLPVRPVTK